MCTGPRPFIPAGNAVKLDLIYTLDLQRVMNVVYIDGQDVWSSENMQDLAANAANSWETNIAPLVADNLQLVLVRVTALNVPSAFGVEYEPVTPIFGDVSGGSLPNNVTLTTKFSSGLTGRSRRGRIYTPAIPRSSVTTSAINEVTAVLAGDFSSSWGNFFTELVGGTDNAAAHVVASFCADGEWRDAALLTPVISYSTNVTLDSQRRRLPERGL